MLKPSASATGSESIQFRDKSKKPIIWRRKSRAMPNSVTNSINRNAGIAGSDTPDLPRERRKYVLKVT